MNHTEGLHPTRRMTAEMRWQLVIALAAWVLYARTLGFGWVFDDQMEVVLNSFVTSFRNIPLIFSSTAWAGSGMETYLYRPLTTLSFAGNHIISGLEPWSYHLANVALHATASVLVFRLGRAWGLPLAAAGMGALLFAVHPVNVEVVTAVFGRKDLLVAVFTLTMVLSHRVAVDRGGWRVVVPILSFAGALLSKEVGLVALPLVATQDWFLCSDRKGFFHSSRRARLYVTYLAILLVYVLVRNTVTGGFSIPDTYYMDNPLVTASLPVRLSTAMVVLGKGLALLALPLTLSPDYSFNAIPLVESIFDWRLLGILAVGGLLVGSLFRSDLRRSFLPFGLSWYLLAILPGSNILVPVGTMFGERFLYLPGMAFCLLAAGGLAWVLRRFPMKAVSLLGLILLSLSFQTFRYSAAWTSDLSLFQWAVRSVPGSTKAHHKLGEAYLEAGDYGSAIRSLNRALRISPDNEFAALTFAGAREAVANKYPDADPTGTPPNPNDPDLLYVLGQRRNQRGDRAGAKEYWEAAIRLEQHHAGAIGDLGALHLAGGDTAVAFNYLAEAVELDNELASAWFGLARIHLDRGERVEARVALKRFIDSAGPRYPNQVEWARMTLALLE